MTRGLAFEFLAVTADALYESLVFWCKKLKQAPKSGSNTRK